MSSGKAAEPRRSCRGALGFGALMLVAVIVAAPGGPAQAEPTSTPSGPVGRPRVPPAQRRQKKRPAKKDAHSASQAARTKGKPAARTAASAAPRAAPGDGLPFALARPSKVTPNQAGKIVVFPFRNDDGGTVSAQVGQLLAARGLDVMLDVKPVDTVEQYRDMATALGLTAYVDGDVRGSDAAARATIRIRSGYSGRKMTEVSFKESRQNLPREISDQLWARLGPSMAHACVDAGRPRKKSRTTLQINAGTPIETVPNAPRARPSSADQAPGSHSGHSARVPARPTAPAPTASSREPASA